MSVEKIFALLKHDTIHYCYIPDTIADKQAPITIHDFFNVTESTRSIPATSKAPTATYTLILIVRAVSIKE